MRRKWPILLAAAALAVLAYRSVLFVDEAEYVIVTQFERPVRTLETAGLHWKWPYQSAIRIDKRLQVYDPRASEFLAREKKNVNLDVFVCWRVEEPQRFVESVGDILGAETRLHDDVLSELADEVGAHPREALVSTDPELHKLEDMVASVTKTCAEQAIAEYGIRVLDVRIKRISLPEQSRESVFKRMREERARIASQYRAEGEEQAMSIRAEADKERTKTLAEAYKVAEETRGRAEAEAMYIYAKAHQKDPEYYELRRTLEAYRKFLDEKTTILLSADSPLLKYLGGGLNQGTQGQEK
jgi:membrane protease subunit HflC